MNIFEKIFDTEVDGKVQGKDGQWYDNWCEAKLADREWYDNLPEGVTIDEEWERKHEEKQYEQEKRRIEKLFEDVGISKKIYDAYINTNFLNESNKKLLKQISDQHSIVSGLDLLFYENKIRKKLGSEVMEDYMDNYELYSLRRKVLDNCNIRVSDDELKIMDNLKAEVKILNDIGKYVLVFLLVQVICCTYIITKTYYSYLPVCIIGCAIVFILLLIVSFKSSNLNCLIKQTFDYKKYISKLKEMLSYEEDKLKTLEERLQSNNKKTIDDFNNFRLNHYNSDIEKLLDIVGFEGKVARLELEYMKVNNGNKKKDGTIEDYIEYFESHS